MDPSNSLLLLTGYSVVIMAVSLLGGWLPSIVRLTHTRTQIVTSFVAGVILCVSLSYLLPHAMIELPGEHSAETAVWWMLVGTVLMVVLLRVFSFHQHDFSHEESGSHDHAHDQTHDHHEHGHVSVNPMSWAGITMGLGLHTMTEGVTLGTSIRAGESDGTIGLSLSVFLAIVLHKPLDGLSIIGTMRAAGFGQHQRVLANVLFSLVCPAATLLTFWGVGLLGQWEAYVVGAALAFAAGALLCIALSDLLPEVHFHSHDRTKLTLAFFAGIGLAYMLHYLEPAGIH
ncbi:MAG: ZIP family metal transporter [Nitrospira sp.]|nr:ZIP family metal transporter [Nitrospira sp.]